MFKIRLPHFAFLLNKPIIKRTFKLKINMRKHDSQPDSISLYVRWVHVFVNVGECFAIAHR